MSFTDKDREILRSRYEKLGESGDHRTTACDFHLRDLEIAFASQYISPGDRLLDVGCGLGYALQKYRKRGAECFGIDYAFSMAKGSKAVQASVLDLPFRDDTFDVVTSSRCLMALLSWPLQQSAILEIHRVLCPGGVMVLMEGTVDGLERLNDLRQQFDLDPIPGEGRDRLFTRKFKEQELTWFATKYFGLVRVQYFGMYYFITRVVHPLMVAPDPPRYDHKINEAAKQIALQYPDYEKIGHLAGFVFRK